MLRLRSTFILLGAVWGAASAIALERPVVNTGNAASVFTYNLSNFTAVPDGDNVRMSSTMLGLWGSFGQKFVIPENWSQYDSFVLRVQNLENRSVKMSIRLDFATNSNDGYQRQRGIFVLRPLQTADVIVEMNNKADTFYKAPVDEGQGFRLCWGNTVNKSTLYQWQLSSHETSSVRVVADRLRLVANLNPTTSAIDQFGQSASGVWQGKVSSLSDLESQRQQELSDLELNPPPSSMFGPTVAGAPTGKWSTVKLPNGRWTLTNFQGKQFWSFGLCAARVMNGTVVQGRQNIFQSLPPDTGTNPFYYNSPQNGARLFDFYEQNLNSKYGSTWETQFPTLVQNRMKSWQLNTISDWADSSTIAQAQMPFILSINTEGSPHRLTAPFRDHRLLPDPFQPGFATFVQQRLAAKIGPHTGNPNFMGFYIDGETKWANPFDQANWYQIGPAVLNSSSTLPAKQTFVRRLQTQYRLISRLNSAWGTNFANFSALNNTSVVNASNTRTAFKTDMKNFSLDYIREYYKQLRIAVNAVGSTGLFLGCRDHSFGPPDLAKLSAPYVDVLPFEGYGYVQDTDWTFGGVDKPVLIYEMHFAATDRGGWNPGHAVCSDQQDRAERVKEYFQHAATRNNVVGAHWFNYVDQPASGRDLDLENIQCGFVSITDTPYQELVDAARHVGRNLYTWRNN